MTKKQRDQGPAESQSEKFKRAARELGADESDEVALDKALRKMKRQPERGEKRTPDESAKD